MIKFDQDLGIVTVGKDCIGLTILQQKIFTPLFFSMPSHITAAALSQRVYGDMEHDTNVMSQMSLIRKKLRLLGISIETVAGRGYRLMEGT